MKTIYRLILPTIVAVLTGFTSCSDEMGPSIYDTTEYALDRSAYTFPLDTFVKVNFLEPYNVRYMYKMEDLGSDLKKNLVPARYEQSKKLAALSKYLWYDVYEKHVGELFLKENSPRIIHVIGSKSFNPTQGTETLGVAEGGIKITLYGANNLEESDIAFMNKYFFHVMHHEFGHILDQTKLHPSRFNEVSRSYNPMGWADTPDSVSAGEGYVTSYASSSYSEDLVEVSSTYITADTLQWVNLLNSASYEWEMIDTEIKSEEEFNKKLLSGVVNQDTVGYFKQTDNGDCKIYRKRCVRDADDHVVLDEEGNVQWSHDSGINGKDVILNKLAIVREWLRESFGLHIDDIRREVQQRQYMTDADGNFLFDSEGQLINRLTQPVQGDPQGRTLMKVLTDEIDSYSSLMTHK